MITVPLSSLAPDKTFKNDTNQPEDSPPPALPKLLPTTAPPANTTPLTKLPSNRDSLQGLTTKMPTSAPEKPQNPAGNSLLLLFPSFFVKY